MKKSRKNISKKLTKKKMRGGTSKPQNLNLNSFIDTYLGKLTPKKEATTLYNTIRQEIMLQKLNLIMDKVKDIETKSEETFKNVEMLFPHLVNRGGALNYDDLEYKNLNIHEILLILINLQKENPEQKVNIDGYIKK